MAHPRTLRCLPCLRNTKETNATRVEYEGDIVVASESREGMKIKMGTDSAGTGNDCGTF